MPSGVNGDTSPQPSGAQELVKIRASQINGYALIGLINLYNRLNVITRRPAGDYQPGQWG